MTEVKVYYSEYGAFLLQKKETQSTFDLLDMKKIEYTKIAVDDAANAEAREEMAQISGTKVWQFLFAQALFAIYQGIISLEASSDPY